MYTNFSGSIAMYSNGVFGNCAQPIAVGMITIYIPNCQLELNYNNKIVSWMITICRLVY
jgi:hypothetical protein